MQVYRLILLAVFASLILSCSDNKIEDEFELTAMERIDKLTSEYSQMLAEPPYGWKLTYQPNPALDVNFKFLIKFNSNGTVKVNSDQRFDATHSKYSVKMLRFPVLIFNSYTDLNIIADPGNSFADRANGQGMGGDFEFYFKETVGDTLFMEEKLHGKKLKFIKATHADVNDYDFQDYGIAEEAMRDIMDYGSYFVNFELKGDADLIGSMKFEPLKRKITFNTYERITNGDNIHFLMPVEQTSFYNYENGNMKLLKEITIAGQKFNELKFGNYNKTNRQLKFSIVGKNLSGKVGTANEPHRTLVGAYNTFASYRFLYVYDGFQNDPAEYKKIMTIPRFKSIHLYLDRRVSETEYVSEFAIQATSAQNPKESDYFNYPIKYSKTGENGIVFTPTGGASNFTDEMFKKTDSFFTKLIKPEGYHIIHEGQINDVSVFTLVDKTDARNFIPIVGQTKR